MAAEWPTHRRKAAQKRPERKRVLAELPAPARTAHVDYVIKRY